MTTQTVIGISESLKPLNIMLNSIDRIVYEKRQIASKIFNHKPIMYWTGIGTQKQQYIEKYGMIAKIKQIGKICEYVNKNYNKIFSFHNKIIELLNVLYQKRSEYITSIDNYKNTHKLSKSEKKILKIAQNQINTKIPNMSNEIGNVLNRLFIKDVALHICEYI
jgi:hypothetical protein